MQSQPASWKPYLALIGGVLCLSLSSLFIRWAQAPGVVTSFYRMTLASIVLFPAFLKSLKTQKSLLKQYWVYPVVGSVFVALDHGFWATSIGMTSVANATLLNNLSSLWVALVAVLIWREQLDRRFWAGLILTLGGAGVVLSIDIFSQPQYTPGNLLAVLSSFFYAGYFLVTQRGRRHLDTISYLWLITAFSAVLFFGTTQVFGMALSGYSQATYLNFVGAALVSQVGGYFLISYALGHLPASLVSPTMIAQPVLTAVLAIPLAGELLSAGQYLGGVVVLVGIYLVDTAHKALEAKE